MTGIKLNRIQQRFWMDHGLKWPSAEYNTTNYTFAVRGALSIGGLREAYRQLMLEYPPLSSVVEVTDGVPCFVPVLVPWSVPLTEAETAQPDEVERRISDFVHLPFDLQRDFPCRFMALRCGRTYYLVHVLHHLVTDGLTFPMFFRRLGEAYAGGLAGSFRPISQRAALEDFNRWLEQRCAGREADDVDYWRRYMGDCPLRLDFPHGTPDPVHPAAFLFELGEAMCRKVSEVCTRYASTPFRLYAAVWALTLSKATDTPRLLLDHTLNLRPEDDARLWGVFVNNLPLRFDFEQGTFADVLRRVGEDLAEERWHRYAFYPDIFHHGEGPGQGRPGGISASVSYKTGYGHMQLQLAGCEVSRYGHCEVKMSQGVALLLEDDAVVSGTLRYGEGVDGGFVRSLAAAFRTVLYQVLAEPSRPLREVQLLSAGERQRLLRTEDGRLRRAALPATVFPRLREVAESCRERVAVEYGDRQLTYGELDRMSTLVADYFIRRGIVRRRIGLSSPKHELLVVVMLGILKSGNVYVPLDAQLPVERLRFMVADCGLEMVVALQLTPSFRDVFRVLGVAAVSFGKLLRGCGDAALETVGSSSSSVSDTRGVPAVEVDPVDDAYLIYTSGTTGRPKAIPIQHAMLYQMAVNTAAYLRLSSASRVSQFANICFDASLYEIFPVLTVGGTLVLPAEEVTRDPREFHAFLNERKISMAYIPPIFLASLPHRPLPHLQTLVVAGDTTPQQTMEYWCDKVRLINAYGPTESTVGATFAVVRPGSLPHDIGEPEPGVTCYVLDRHRQLMPDGMMGELYIGGVKLSAGYVNRPQLNGEKFIPNPYVSPQDRVMGRNTTLYRTGDLVIRRSDGHLLFMGRSDFQVKLHGYRIELGEIEAKVGEYGHGVRAAVVMLQEQGDRKLLVAYVQVDDAHGFQVEDLRDFLRLQLPAYMVPAVIFPMTDFPCNASGKVDLKRLPAPASLPMEEQRTEALVTDTEKRLAAVWTGLLPGHHPGRDDDFMAMGGDSLSVIQLCFLIEQSWGVPVKASEIYRYTSLRTMSRLIDRKVLDVSAAAEVSRGAGAQEEGTPALCYWATAYDAEKPLLLIVCGYGYYKPYYLALTEKLRDGYSLLILESYYESFPINGHYRLEDLLTSYVEMLRPVLRSKSLFGIIGFCLGGEIGLQLAVVLARNKMARPKVFVIDGFASRDNVEDVLLVDEPGVSEEVNRARNQITRRLLESFFFQVYEGETYVCLASQFSTMLLAGAQIQSLATPVSLSFPPEKSEAYQRAYERFLCNAKTWKEMMPHCQIHYLSCDHMNLNSAVPCEEVRQIIDAARRTSGGG